MKMIISAGGTGGHIYPAIAIINKFKEKEKDLEILYIGTHNRMEKDIIPKLNIKYIPIEMYGFSKTDIKRDIKNLFLIKKAENKCREIIKEFKPDIVLGIGGYITYPVIKAAKKEGIKTFIHEQNSIPGKTNRFLSKAIDLVGISFNNSKKYFSKAKKVVYTGNPCSSNALTTKEITKESLGFSKNKKLILIVFGSLGSSTLNNKMKSFLKVVNKDYEVLYITGNNYYNDFVKENFSSNIKIMPFLDNLSGLMKNIDLIISRAGASTISEILALKVPSILIPSPYVANNHQYYNALDLKNMGVSILVKEEELNIQNLNMVVNDLLKDNSLEYEKMKNNLIKLNMDNSSEIIYKEIKDIL